MSRRVRGFAMAMVLAVAALTLSACEQPEPRITIQTGSFSTTISPSTYCFDATHCRASGRLDFPVVTTGPDSTVLIDVPRAVANTGWIVRVFAFGGAGASGAASGSSTASSAATGGGSLKALGSTPTIRGLHTYRLAANSNDGDSFIAEVNQVRGAADRADGSAWSFLVQTSQT